MTSSCTAYRTRQRDGWQVPEQVKGRASVSSNQMMYGVLLTKQLIEEGWLDVDELAKVRPVIVLVRNYKTVPRESAA